MTAPALEEAASSLIREGYHPLGGPIAEPDRTYAQAFWKPASPATIQPKQKSRHPE